MRFATFFRFAALIAVAPLIAADGCGGDGAGVSVTPLVLQTPASWSAWSDPVLVEELSTPTSDENSPAFSNDGLSVYFGSNRTGTLGGTDLMVARRASKEDPWGTPQFLGSVVNSTTNDNAPTLSKNGLVLIFLSNRTGGFGANDLYVSRRTDASDDFSWGAPENLGSDVNTSGDENQPYLQKVGEGGEPTLYFNRGTPTDIYAAPVDDDGQTLGIAAAIQELNSSASDAGISISKNGLELYFHSGRTGSSGIFDLWMSTRASVDDPWSEPQNLGSSINSSVADFAPALSSDGRTLMFTRGPAASGTQDLMILTRTPLGGGNGGD